MGSRGLLAASRMSVARPRARLGARAMSGHSAGGDPGSALKMKNCHPATPADADYCGPSTQPPMPCR